MVQLTEFETIALKSAYFARKDLTSDSFLETFVPLWSNLTQQIESLSRKFGYPIDFKQTRIAFTLKPTRTLAFCPPQNAYLINVWFLLFSGDDKNAIMRMPLELTARFVHENNHREFCRKHEMIGQDSESTAKFINQFYPQIEMEAYYQEIDFIEKARVAVSSKSIVHSFRVNSWSIDGVPECVVFDIEINPEGKLFVLETECEMSLQRLEHSSREDFDTVTEGNKIAWYDRISKTLNLSKPSLDSSIVGLNPSDDFSHGESNEKK
jgi:hypothetical protein